MFNNCIHCYSDLGHNTVLEVFPVGSRLAFDADRGRLWVVCRRCDRWNLTPLDERWEAIEECERRFSSTALRASTDQIGLARLPEGLELIRIGNPQRPEFAAWRYGDRFGRRRRANILKAGLGLGALGAVVAGGAAVGVGVGSVGWLLYQSAHNIVRGSPEKVVARIPTEEGKRLKVRRKHLPNIHLYSGDTFGGWSLGIPKGKKKLYTVRGDDALRAAGALLPHYNRYGGTKRGVEDAVSFLENARDPIACFDQAASMVQFKKKNTVSSLPQAATLALEMAANEETERRVIEGELQALERAWRDAEEVAAIADNLLIPKSVERLIGKWRA